MARSQEPGKSIERRAKVVVVALLGYTRVQGDPHPKGGVLAPGFGLEGTLGSERGLKRIERRDKGGTEGVAGPLEDLPKVRLDALAEDHIVLGESSLHGVAMLLPARRAALDVGEEKGDGAGGQGGHAA